jgi:hypothetical protein
MQTISVSREGKEWAVSLDDREGGKSEVLGTYPDRGPAVESALHAARVRGIDLAEPVEQAKKADKASS